MESPHTFYNIFLKSNTCHPSSNVVYLINANYGWAVGVGIVIVKNDNADLPVELNFLKGINLIIM